MSGRPITAGAKCPSCYNPIEPGWQWCHHCGYDPEGLDPDGDGPSPPPKGAPPPDPEPDEPELFDAKPLITSDLLGGAPLAGGPPFDPLRSGGTPVTQGAGDGTESFGPAGSASAQTGPYAPPELKPTTVRERILSPIGIVFVVLLIICVALAIAAVVWL